MIHYHGTMNWAAAELERLRTALDDITERANGPGTDAHCLAAVRAKLAHLQTGKRQTLEAGAALPADDSPFSLPDATRDGDGTWWHGKWHGDPPVRAILDAMPTARAAVQPAVALSPLGNPCLNDPCLRAADGSECWPCDYGSS